MSARKRNPLPQRRRSRAANNSPSDDSRRRKPSRRNRRANVGALFEQLVALQKRLRAPDGCPWDREQTHASLRTFLIEETYEVLGAIEKQDPQKLVSELGDLLLQIVFHAQLAAEDGRFDMADVIEAIHKKMVRRHRHVFGRAKAGTSAEVLKNWEQLKVEERREETGEAGRGDASGSILAGVPRTLPALLEALQLTRRASHIGFDWENVAGIFEKLREETEELRGALDTGNAATSGRGMHPRQRVGEAVEEEVGDVLFAAVNLARFLGLDPEIALKKANRKFITRFERMERQMRREGRRLADAPRERMEELWNESKRRA